MRQTYDRETLVRKWLMQAQPSARDNIGGSLFFEGDTIYSYGKHFPIARLFRTVKEEIILFTVRENSITTEKHKSIVSRVVANASSPRVLLWPDIDHINPDPTGGMLVCKNGFDVAAAKHNRARKPGLYVHEIYKWVDICADFYATVHPGRTTPKWAQLPKGIEPGAPLTAALLIHA